MRVRSSMTANGAQLFGYTTSAPSKASSIEEQTLKAPPESFANAPAFPTTSSISE